MPSRGGRLDACDAVAEPGGFEAMIFSNTLLKLASRLAHPCQRGLVAGRSMAENVMRMLACIHLSLHFLSFDVAVVSFGVKVAFPSLGWDWIWEVLAEMRVPGWIVGALRFLCVGPTARILFAGVVTDEARIRALARYGRWCSTRRCAYSALGCKVTGTRCRYSPMTSLPRLLTCSPACRAAGLALNYA